MNTKKPKKERNKDIYIKKIQMKNSNNSIDNLITRILSEEIDNKSKEKSDELEETLKGGQKKLDVAKPKGKLDAADFKKLRSMKKETKESEEMKEFFFEVEDDDDDDEFTHGDYEGDEEAEDEAEELSAQEPTYVGKSLEDNKMKAGIANKFFGSFADEHGWFDNMDYPYEGSFDFDFEEEEFPDFDSLMASPYAREQRWFAPERSDAKKHGMVGDGRKFFDLYQKKFGGKPFRIRKMKSLDEQGETEEGNKFSGELDKARKEHKKSFDVDGKTYQVKESEEKWIQDTKMKKGALHKKLGVPEGDKIPQAKLKALKKELMKKGEGDKKLTAADSKLLKQVNLALTLKNIKESVNKLTLTEDELIDMIEKIVVEQKVKDKAEKGNISKKEASGLKKTEKVLSASKKENEDYAKEVVKKMKEYVKAGSKGEYTESPETFPQSNYTMDKMKEKTMKYHPSQAVDEYIDAFAHPGMTNLVYDEIKPDDKKIDKYLKGDSTTGNAVKDKDGKALGNVVPSEVGEKFKKNYDENLYGAEQMNVSYKRQPQPVDVGGSEKMDGSLKSIRKGSTNKAQKIMNQLESKQEEKKKVKINEDMEKMKNLITYNRKTQ
jgi:hypothetical protein